MWYDVSWQLTLCCRPYGTVWLNIKATWIQNASPQQDALTDLSYMSSLGKQSMDPSEFDKDSVDQVTVHLWALECLKKQLAPSA